MNTLFRSKYKKIVSFIIFFCIIYGCTTLDIYEKSIAFPQHSWSSNDTASLSFSITDTAAFYNLYVVLRHEDAYGYKNIWLNIQVKGPDSTFAFRREFTLANNIKWLGSSMDDIIEHRIVFNTVPLKLKKGLYVFSLQQAMREDPLQHMLNTGIRVEKATP
jgi:gliding motility-associated lipoprotein GldH